MKRKLGKSALTKVPGWPYAVTRKGELYRLMANGGIRHMQCPPDEWGYRAAHMRNGPGKHRHTTLNIVMLETFVGPKPLNHETKFLDGNKLNCAISNLKWVPVSRANINQGEAHFDAVLTEAQVLEARARAANGEKVAHFAHEYGIHESALRSVVNGARWKHLPGAIKRKSGPAKLPPELRAKRKTVATGRKSRARTARGIKLVKAMVAEQIERGIDAKETLTANRQGLNALIAARLDEAEGFERFYKRVGKKPRKSRAKV